MQESKMLTAGIVLLVVVALNFLPSIIALVRRHPERRLLMQLNILSLLSFLLWLALFAWAVGGKRDDGVIGQFTAKENRGRLTALVVVLVGAGVASTAYALSRR